MPTQIDKSYEEKYKEFFAHATGIREPYPYQVRLATGKTFPELLDIPTGLGKTAAVVMAWLWRRRHDARFKAETPRRLVYCLPMRVLVEQTQKNVEKWLTNLQELGQAGDKKVSVHLLMGGESDLKSWAEYPEEDMILIGTQDMLLSRALMRGYGMSRYQWPMHFALLHNDAQWVFDEVQLMGAGLSTSAQMEAFRRILKPAFPCRSLWVSATLNKAWLSTVDMQEHIDQLNTLKLNQTEIRSKVISERREALKRLQHAKAKITPETSKQEFKSYVEALVKEVLEKHQRGSQTLVIVNTVTRAQTIYKSLCKQKWDEQNLLLVHSRFRPEERRKINSRLEEKPDEKGPGRIIVATQAVEAGIDISCRVLFTELAPWPSLVQRFGRCNRYGEWKKEGADVFWVDIVEDAKDVKPAPYDAKELKVARAKLKKLESASPSDLPRVEEETPLHAVLRRKDFVDLFNIDSDLSGYDVDISPYIRDAGEQDVLFFWRDPSQEEPLQREEICHASIGQASKLIKRLEDQKKYAKVWDSLSGEWRNIREKEFRPGLTLMLDSSFGGYDSKLGFKPDENSVVTVLFSAKNAKPAEAYDSDDHGRHAVLIAKHLCDAEDASRDLCAELIVNEPEAEAVARAARWHDTGKAHPVFQGTMHGCTPEEVEGRELLAKSAARDKLGGEESAKGKKPALRKASKGHVRPHFRHELASTLVWMAQHGAEEHADLIAYLIAAHHGKVRLSLRSMPEELEPRPPLGPRYARGIWEGDRLPGFEIAKRDHVEPSILKLDIMELGEGDGGPSWTARVLKLLRQYGPFQLAWLETLVRLADWRSSRQEQGDEQ